MLIKKKRGQIFSIDLVFAVMIFLIAVALFYVNFRLVPEQRVERRLDIDPNFLFQNIEENTKIYDKNYQTEISFLNGFKVNEANLTNFANIDYKDFKEILFTNILVSGLDVDACLYFTNRSGFIVPINNKANHIAGIGNMTNEYIIVEEDSEIEYDDISC